jgi:hypothetical protein
MPKKDVRAFGKRPVSFPRFVRVPEQPNERLIDADARLFGACASPQRESRVVTQLELMVKRNVFVADPAIDGAIRKSPEPAPAVIRPGILRVKDKVDACVQLGFESVVDNRSKASHDSFDLTVWIERKERPL